MDKKLSDASINIALDNEMKLSLQSKFDGEQFVRKFDEWRAKKLTNEDNGLTICYDMGWNKRSTGTRYDSISGQGVMVGALSRKVVGFTTKSKTCRECKRLEKRLQMFQFHIMKIAFAITMGAPNQWSVRLSSIY